VSGVNMFCLQRQFKFAIDMTVISA
jgi:hypothetical protein